MITILVGLGVGAFLVSAQVTKQPVTAPTGSPATMPTSTTVAQLEDNEDCFTDDNRNACQPGSYSCFVYERTDCCPCPDDTFQPAYNQCPSCVTCKDCKKVNKRTAVICNITQDTVCGKKLPPTTTEATIPVLTETPVIEDRTSSPCKDCDCSTCCLPPQHIPNDVHWWQSCFFLAVTCVLAAIISSWVC